MGVPLVDMPPIGVALIGVPLISVTLIGVPPIGMALIATNIGIAVERVKGTCEMR